MEKIMERKLNYWVMHFLPHFLEENEEDFFFVAFSLLFSFAFFHGIQNKKIIFFNIFFPFLSTF